jgi:MFS family permease
MTPKQDGIIVDDTEIKLEPSHPRSSRLWGSRNFRMYWAGRAINAVGDSFAMIAIPLLVLEVSGSVAQMGLVSGTIGLSSLLAGIISGSLADRMDRRKLLIAFDISRAFFYLLIPIGWNLLGPSMWLIYIVSAITSYLTTSFIITSTAALTNLVDQDKITEANGHVQAAVALAFVIGPMLAGFAAKQLSLPLAVGMISVPYMVTPLIMFFVRLPRAFFSGPPPGLRKWYSHAAEFFAGVRFLLSHPVLKSVTMLLALVTFVGNAVIDLSIFHLRLDMNQTGNSVGIVFGLASLGAVLAGGLASRLRHRWGFGLCFLGSLILQGISIIFIGLAPTVPIIAALAMAYAFTNTLIRVTSMSLRQQVTPDHLMGRVSSAYWTFLAVLGPLGTTVATTFAQGAGAPFTLILVGMIIVFVAMIGLFTPARTQRPEEQKALFAT